MNTKNIFKTLALAMLMPAMLLTTACSNEDFASDDKTATTETVATNQGYALPVTVNVSRQGDATTRATYNESTKKLEFNAGDKLFVSGTAGGYDYDFAGTLDYVSEGTFSGTIYIDKEWPGTSKELLATVMSYEHLYATLLPAGYEEYGFLTIDNNGTEAKYDDSVDFNFTYTLASSKAAGVEQFSYEQATEYNDGFALEPRSTILNFTITGLAANTNVDVALTGNTSAYNITRTVTTDASGTATFAAGIYNGASLNLFSLTVGGKAITLPTKDAEVGNIYNITRNAISGALIGQFSVSDTKKVYFSKGNLQATYNTSWSWAFATNQWDYIGNAAGNTSINGGGTISGTGTVDLFGWVGTTCAWTGAAQYGISNVTAAAQYGNVEGEALMSDWGTLAITNGGNTANFGWHSLASSEWEYLFKTRTTPSSVRYAHATVNSVPGLVLLPDDWSTDYYSLNKVNDANSTAYTDNPISSSDWTSKLEAHGAVFLPAGGYRNGATVSNAGDKGYYWSSTSDTDSNLKEYALGFSFGSGKFVGGTTDFVRNRGCSVRLVYDAN